MKTGNAPGEDDIRPEMNTFGVRWLTRACRVACRTGQAPKQWQTRVIMRKCTNYGDISLINVPGKVYAQCHEKKNAVKQSSIN